MRAKIIYILLAYLIGSIPTAAWYAKLNFGIDIKKHGSGNSGATNSMRVMGKKAAIIVLIIDILKGFLPVYFYNYCFQDEKFALLIGVVVVMGHVFSIFVDFKGGKGVASALGVIIAAFPVGAVICIPVFILVVKLSKYVSLGSILAALAFAIIVSIQHLNDFEYIFIAFFLFLFLVFTHRENIAKMLNGTENTFPAKKS